MPKPVGRRGREGREALRRRERGTAWATAELVDGSRGPRAPKLYNHGPRSGSTVRLGKRAAGRSSSPRPASRSASSSTTCRGGRCRFKPADPDLRSTRAALELGDCATLCSSAAHAASKGNEGTPALLFEGVGPGVGEDQPVERIEKNIVRYGRDWTMNLRAIGTHHLGPRRCARGTRGGSRSQGRLPGRRFGGRCDRARSRGRRPRKCRFWTGCAFPLTTAADALGREEDRRARRDAARRGGAPAAAGVRVLATDRSNGPTTSFLNRWHNYAEPGLAP